jgi:hypothetical protein
MASANSFRGRHGAFRFRDAPAGSGREGPDAGVNERIIMPPQGFLGAFNSMQQLIDKWSKPAFSRRTTNRSKFPESEGKEWRIWRKKRFSRTVSADSFRWRHGAFRFRDAPAEADGKAPTPVVNERIFMPPQGFLGRSIRCSS